MSTKTEHTGAKDSSRKSGYWGRRKEAKTVSKSLRRIMDKKIINKELK